MSTNSSLTDDDREQLARILEANTNSGRTLGHYGTRVPEWWLDRYADGVIITPNPRSDTSIHALAADASPDAPAPACGDEAELDADREWRGYPLADRPDRPWCKKCRRNVYQDSGVDAALARHAAAEGAQVHDHPFHRSESQT